MPLLEEKAFCILPWIHMRVRQDGHVFPCCAYRDSIGDLHDTSFQALWNSEAMRGLRLNILEGKESSGCASCYERDSFGMSSVRRRMNAAFVHHVGRLPKTRPDGSAPEFKLPYLHVRFSNVCNFKCRTCGPRWSTAWYDDARDLARSGVLPNYTGRWFLEPDDVRRWGRHPLPGPGALRAAKDSTTLWSEIEPLLPHAEQIQFTGGEPLLHDEHYRVLDFLIERKMFHVGLNYHTNLSVARVGDRDIHELWSRFENVTVYASLDASGRRGEYLRSGQNWDETVRVRRRMRDACPRVKFVWSPVVSLFNVLHLPDLHREWVESGLMALEDGAYLHNILTDPPEYRVQALTADLKQAVRDTYEEYGAWCENRWGGSASRPLRDALRTIARFMDARDLSAELPRFRDVTRCLDRLRGESFESTFPELAGLMKD